ncbi:hypothetical protein [Blastopirellula marina]|uniref:TNase-like domain-containing protein n=1 Tax=Blastopirellula marina DSM 3645 TaxID=314230 RepID=A3ZMS3_9BACT|nr:hypothetical protein [Blastopirellula marina]EAQ82249.1 hypothetical protein DSM3645_01005 [Blastopirellula marina DSM 3645]
MHRLLWATLAVASAISISNPAGAQPKEKEVKIRDLLGVQAERLITVASVADLDDIRIRFGDKTARVRLASVAPFHEWPVADSPTWSKKRDQLKQRVVDRLEGNDFLVRLAICQLEGKPPAVYLEDRATYLIDRESMWEGLKPAQRVGWARTSQNIDLVYKGLSIYRPECKARPYDLEKLFEEAQQNAEVFRRGLWSEYRFARAVESTDAKIPH